MQTTLRATSTDSQRRLDPERHSTFWIPRLIRTAPEPDPTVSPPGDTTTQHIAPATTCEVPCDVPVNDPEVADDGQADAHEASELAAESEARRAMETAARLVAEDEARLAVERALARELKFWADRSGQREAELAERRATDSDDARAKPAGTPAADDEASTPRARKGRGAAILAALALAATAIALLTMPGLAGGPVSASGREHGLSDSKSAGASDLVVGSPGAGVGPDIAPVFAPPAARTTPTAAEPALVARDRAPATSLVVIPAALVEAVAAGAALAASPASAPETSSTIDNVPKDMTDETGSILPVEADAGGAGGATVIDVVPAPPEVPTSALRRATRPPRGRAPQPDREVADDAPVGAPIIPTSRDVMDAPVEVPASGE